MSTSSTFATSFGVGKTISLVSSNAHHSCECGSQFEAVVDRAVVVHIWIVRIDVLARI